MKTFKGVRQASLSFYDDLQPLAFKKSFPAAARTGSKTRSERREDRSRAGRGTGRRPRPRQGRGGSGKEGGRTGGGVWKGGRKDGKWEGRNEEGLGVQKRKGRRRQVVTILLSVVAPQRRQPPALPPFRAVPSAHAGLTSLFGMGRGVAPPRRRRFLFPEPHKRDPVCRERELRNEETNVIGLLVRVGSVHRCTCTSRLSTW